MTRTIWSAVVLLAFANGCALESAADSEQLGSSAQKLGSMNMHFVNATLQSGVAHCPVNEMLVGVDPASQTRLVCVYAPGSSGVNGLDGTRSDYTQHRVNGTATCNSAYAVAVGWNHDNGDLICHPVTVNIFGYTPDGNGTSQTSELTAVSHQTTTFYFQNGNIADEMTVCNTGRGIRDISFKSLNPGGFRFFYTCAAG